MAGSKLELRSSEVATQITAARSIRMRYYAVTILAAQLFTNAPKRSSLGEIVSGSGKAQEALEELEVSSGGFLGLADGV